MNGTNNINFTGIRNIGYVGFERPVLLNTIKSNSLSMVLSDDLKGKDLLEFWEVIAKIPKNKYGYKHPFSKELLNIECSSLNGFDVLLINGRPIKVDDEHLPMFSYIARLTRRIAGMKDSEMLVNNDYKEFAAKDTLIYQSKAAPVFVKNGNLTSVDKFFERDFVRRGAKNVNEFVQKLMNKYFCIE